MQTFSQFGQDGFAIEFFEGARDGFFVDVGACMPEAISNTCALEREYGWEGLLIEGNEEFCRVLKEERSSVCINTYVSANGGPCLLSIIDGIGDSLAGYKAGHRAGMPTVQTRTLTEILDANNAPKEIDFLSLDIEGAEYDVLSTFDFDKYRFGLMTVEHNGQEGQITSLLGAHGYRFIQRMGEDALYEYVGECCV